MSAFTRASTFLADGSGAVVIPEAEINEVLADAFEIRAQDARARERIAAGERDDERHGAQWAATEENGGIRA